MATNVNSVIKDTYQMTQTQFCFRQRAEKKHRLFANISENKKIYELKKRGKARPTIYPHVNIRKVRQRSHTIHQELRFIQLLVQCATNEVHY